MSDFLRNVYRERHNFAKIKTSFPIPNLLEVQKKSYQRFLQMDLLPSEREDVGLQSVFNSVFPITDFRGTSSLEFVDYSIGNWECKCGKLRGLEHLRAKCSHCGETIVLNPYSIEDVICKKCGTYNSNDVTRCDDCGDPVQLNLKYNIEECQERGMTYAVPLKVTIRLVVWDKDPDTDAKTIRDIKEQEVYFGDIPLMTENGIFIINGTERVIVSQLHRSPGVFFESTPSKSFFLGKIIPYRGSWIEFEYDLKNLLYVRIDRKRKFLATTFLRALVFHFWEAKKKQLERDKVSEEKIKEDVEKLKSRLESDEQIIREFYTVVDIKVDGKKLFRRLEPDLIGLKISKDIHDSKSSRKVLHQGGKKITHSIYTTLEKAGVKEIEIDVEDLEGAFSASEVVDTKSGEIILEANNEVSAAKLNATIEAKIEKLSIFFPERDDIGVVLSETLRKDNIKTTNEALIEIYRKQRPGDPPTLETASQLFHGMFFDSRKYDFSKVGRLKFNIKLGLDTPLDERILSPRDFYEVIRYLLKLRKSIGTVDDIDHLGNRRVRAVGELLENQFRIGLVRMERAIKEKMSVHQEMATAMPHDLINAKPVMASIREFFGSSQLSQFMDQTNPLSEITHKRRLSALGPGGLSRERAGFEVRDVHPTHYGRICPIETPEGPNIGLISSLSCYARINEYGFIESPYRRVKEGRVMDYVLITNAGDTNLKIGGHYTLEEVETLNKKLRKAEKREAEYEPYAFYMTAWDADKHVIAQANVELDEKGNILQDRVSARHQGNFVSATLAEIEYIDVSPKQLVSVAASLIPFLEHDDANRALMGSNMQRQAVPLVQAEAPFVGTGMEYIAARDSGAVILCRRPGAVDSVDAERIIVRVESADGPSRDAGVDIYQLTKFKRSNQNTCINQKPLVRRGDRVEKAQVLADGPCTEKGELALGRNVLVSFMPWRGYNFEDAILVSEKLVKEDLYTSIHIEELEIEARDTKLGSEEITRDIPNVSDTILKDLDESGIIRIGAKVAPGAILVGKVTPKGETQLTPEEKLLRAIFGEKAGDVRDASLYTPPGIEGIVVDVKIFSRKGVPKDERATQIENQEIAKLEKDLNDEIRILRDERDKRLASLLVGKKLAVSLAVGDETHKKSEKITAKMLEGFSHAALKKIKVEGKEAQAEFEKIEDKTERQVEILKSLHEEKLSRLKKGDELPPGVIKMVKVYVAMKRKLSVGDKMAGRHGNKGVIARILPEEDMPYMPDGTPVEIVLNPLGVPSRMNVGQIMETHLGWAARAVGLHYATPVFDGATEAEIKGQLDSSRLPITGKTELYDGMTGEKFDQNVTVGYIYMLKLSHLVDDKIHARSIGPYSLITQQPLGGKAQFGGQRFGEMEVWALEAYGAANILQELLTAKSDDVQGRAKIYEAIVKGESTYSPGIPESFNVLIRELQSLALDVELIEKSKKKTRRDAKAVEEAQVAEG
ncbi:MAG TPA: DNA-directed RNA polymerase subunit beta [Acidobacteriota bacterium]|jgi:DNA-directed RNA polymerase subunit beta|nr:DNA-directed RNA polymerase subunit beta [Acidobacteriota bacterium]